MTPQKQLISHNPPHSYGDCLRACIASLCDLKIEEVPHFEDKDEPYSVLRATKWLRDTHKIELRVAEKLHDAFLIPENTYYIEIGPILALENKGYHCRIGRNGKLIHDPSTVPVDMAGIDWILYDKRADKHYDRMNDILNGEMYGDASTNS